LNIAKLNRDSSRLLIIFLAGVLVLLSPCTALPGDIFLAEAPVTVGGHISTDGNLVAFYSESKGAEIILFTPGGKEFRHIPLTTHTCVLESLSMSDGRVYYAESDTAVPPTKRVETVFEYTVETGKKQALYTTTSDSDLIAKNADEILKNGGQYDSERVTKIVADGDHVVLRGGGGDRKLILLTLPNGSSRTIFTSNDYIHGLAIDGDRILWGCERTDKEPGREIHIYTISTSKDSIIPESKSIRTWGYGDISGDRVVWNMAAEEPDTSLGYPSLVNAGGDIRLTDLSTGKTQSIEILNTPETPFISVDTIVYLKKPEIDYNNSDTGTVRVYDISTGSFSDIASEVAGITDFDNGLVLWHKLKPMTFWVTPVSGKNTATGTSATTAETGIQVPAMQNTPPPESPVGMIVIVLAVTVGIVVYIILKRKASH
jgi:hypothetical protein